jgi:hypothetical protein
VKEAWRAVEFSSDAEMRKIPELAREFFTLVLDGEFEPLFVSDETKIWDVSMAAPDELLRRCAEYYGVPVSLEDLKQPLWQLLPRLKRRERSY